jgi:hypothetical protein
MAPPLSRSSAVYAEADDDAPVALGIPWVGSQSAEAAKFSVEGPTPP